MPQNERRAALLKSIVHLRPNYLEHIKMVKMMPWDCEYPLVKLKLPDLLTALRQTINGDISFAELSEWANFLEIREDILLEEENIDLIRDTIFELANPELSGCKSDEILEILVKQLKFQKN